MPHTPQPSGTLSEARTRVGIVLALGLFALISACFAQEAPQAVPTPPAQAAPRQLAQRNAAPARPRIRLSTLKPIAGKSVTISGRGLPAGSQVTARLTTPAGTVRHESTRVEDSGRFRLVLRLLEAGEYRLVVRGQGLDQTRVLEARRPETLPPRPTPKPKQPPTSHP